MKTRLTELSATPLIISLVASLAFALSLFIAPLAIAASPPCGSTITTDTTLDSDMTCSGTAITIGADNITLDGAGHTITGDTSGGGVENYGYNYVTVKNCTVTNFNHGIFFQSCSHSTLDSNTVSSNVGAGNAGGGGMNLQYGSNNSLTNNTVNSNVAGGIGVSSSSSNLTNNTANSNSTAIGIDIEGSNNVVTSNTANLNGTGLKIGGANNNVLSSNTANFNSDGIFLYASNSNTLDSNTADSNGAYGIWVFYSNGNIITGNTVKSNGNDGIFLYFDSSGNRVGGTTTGAGNTIAFNGGNGVDVVEGQGATGNTISQNSIFSNSRLGIDLGGDGVTPNDPCDADNDLHDNQNFPVLYSVFSAGGSTTVAGALNSTPNTSFTIEFFSNDVGNPSGFGEGQTFIGSTQVTTSADCNVSFAAVFPVTLSTSQVVTMTATNSSGTTSEFSNWTPSPVCTPPPDGMVSWWPGDNTATDIQSGNNGTLKNGATFANGKVDRAFSFNGADGYVDLGTANLLGGTTQITLDAWIYPTSFPGYMGIIYPNSTVWWMQTIENTGRIRFAAVNTYVDSQNAVPLNQWSHVAGTWDGSRLRVYINGVQDPNTAVATGTMGSDAGVTKAIGSHGGLDQFFSGLIDEVEVFNRALTADEIQSIFNAGGSGKCKTVRFYVSNDGNNTIEKFDAAGDDLGTFANSGLNNPIGLAFDPSGNLYAANSGDSTIEKFSPTGVDLGVFANTGLSAPTALVFDIAGNLYAANSNESASNSVEKFSPTGTDLGVFASGPPPFNAYSMVFDSAGNLYVENADNSRNTIEKFSPTGTDLGVFASAGLSVPTGLILDSVGNFYAVNSTLDTIEKISPTGTDLGVFANTPSGRNFGIASDSAGNFYVTNYTNSKIEKFSATGIDLGVFASTGLNSPFFIAVQLLSPTAACIQFSSPSYSVNETDGSVTLTVTRNGDVSGSATVHYATSDGTATAPSDYAATSGDLNFGANETSKSIQVPIIEGTDPANEDVEPPTKTFKVTLSNTSGAMLSGPSTATVTIVDNDAGSEPPTVQVTVQTNPTGLTFTVDSTTYTAAQTFTWHSGSNHTIATTSPQSGGTGVRYVWGSWSGGGAISHTVAPTKNTTYTASFTKQYSLTMSHGTGGTVSPSSGWKNSGAAISITATPTNNTSVSYTFSNWTGSGTGSYSGTNNPASITMSGPITETAAFTQNPVQVTVQINPAGLSFTVDGTAYTAAQTFSWAPGSSHTIATTSPQSGGTGIRYVWNSWSGGGAISHTVTPTKNTTYTAKFTTQYYLTMSHGTGGTVSPSSGWRNSGATLSISATPATGYSFTNWTGTGTGSYSGTNNPSSVTMGGPITETATFTHN
jgi:parallel beta-helix repeat protein